MWSQSVEAHRAAVRDAVLDAVSALAAEQGLHEVTMSSLAGRAGIGRATLYKYFPDLGVVLLAWHGRQIQRHLQELAGLAEGGDPGTRLRRVLEHYARRRREEHGPEIGAVLHGSEHVAHAESHVEDLFANVLDEAAAVGAARSDMPPRDMARFALHALAAARDAPSQAAVDRLVELTLAALASR